MSLMDSLNWINLWVVIRGTRQNKPFDPLIVTYLMVSNSKVLLMWSSKNTERYFSSYFMSEIYKTQGY